MAEFLIPSSTTEMLKKQARGLGEAIVSFY